MNQAVYYAGSGRYEWRETQTPSLQDPTDALVRPVAVTTCDLDRAIARGLLDALGTDFPVGHECIADVVEVGDDVSALRPGDQIIVPFQVSCGSCRLCRRGLTGNCGRLPPTSTFGLGEAARTWGGFLSDRLRLPWADHLGVPLPDGMGAEAAGLSDNVCDAWRAVVPYLDDTEGPILIEGGGSIGLYATAFAVAEGREVHYRDRSADRLEQAERLGAVIDDTPLDQPAGVYELSVNTSPRAASLMGAALSVGPGGVFVTTGVHVRPGTEVPIWHLYRNSARIVNELVPARHVMPQVLAWLGANDVDLGFFIDEHVAWPDAAAALPAHDQKLLITR